MKRSFISLWLMLLFFASDAHPAFELSGAGSRIRAMGFAYAGLANTPDAVYLNSSGLAAIAVPVFSASYFSPFGIKELTHVSLAAVFPVAIGNLGVSISRFGNDLYSEQTALLSYSRKLSENFYFGTNIHYHKLQIKGYGSDFCVGIDAGILYKFSATVNWGFFTTNINRPKFGSADDYLPQFFISGVHLKPTENININIDLFKEIAFPVELRAGIEYILARKIAFRCGFATEPAQFCAGLGFIFQHVNCDYAMSTHLDLGLTHQFSISFRLTKNSTH